MSTTTTPADQIRTARRRANMTQQKLAEVLGCSLRAVQGWERDGRAPSSRWVGPLSRVLDIPVGALVAS